MSIKPIYHKESRLLVLLIHGVVSSEQVEQSINDGVQIYRTESLAGELLVMDRRARFDPMLYSVGGDITKNMALRIGMDMAMKSAMICTYEQETDAPQFWSILTKVRGIRQYRFYRDLDGAAEWLGVEPHVLGTVLDQTTAEMGTRLEL